MSRETGQRIIMKLIENDEVGVFWGVLFKCQSKLELYRMINEFIIFGGPDG